MESRIDAAHKALSLVWESGWRALLAGMTLFDVMEKSLSITLLVITIGWTLYKWRRDIVKARAEAARVKV